MDARAKGRTLLLLGAAAIVAFLLGLALARQRLPEWAHRPVPERAWFAERFGLAVARAGLAADEPGFRLRSEPWLSQELEAASGDPVWDVHGARAVAWLIHRGRGPFVEAVAPAHWTHASESSGELHVVFSLRGEPMAASWLPADPFDLALEGAEERRRALTRIVVPSADAAPVAELRVLGQRVHAFRVGPGGEETVFAVEPMGSGFPLVQRVHAPLDWLAPRLENVSIRSLVLARLPRWIIGSLFALGTLVLFLVLLARRRIELSKGAIIGALSVVLSAPAAVAFGLSGVGAIDVFLDILAKGLALFVLWSAAESWMRSIMPGFRTSLDVLRAGRVGPRSGSSLLAGWAIGAALGGVSFLGFVVSTFVPGAAPREASVPLPLFGAGASPLDEGVIRTAMVLLVIALVLRFPRLSRIPGLATALAAILIATRLPFSSMWASIALGAVLAGVLVRTHLAFGLTALLTAGMMATILPGAAYAALHFGWLAPSALVLGAFALLPLGAGLVGIRRGPDAEDAPMRLPAFVRRLEEENRLRHEMDLLAAMQIGLLPRETPRIAGWEIAARSLLANEAGGDLYDFVETGDGALWVAAGDVAGHGYSCAIAQAMTKAGLASLIEPGRTPAGVLERLDRVLRASGSDRTFTTLALLRIDLDAGAAMFGNAGHPYPLLVPRDGGITEIESPSLPLGKGPGRSYEDIAVDLPPGATLVLASDGLFEALDAGGRPYGYERLRDVAGGRRGASAAEVLETILADWAGHRGGMSAADDTTIVVLRRCVT